MIKHTYSFLILLILPILIPAQKKDLFNNSDVTPDCSVIRNGLFTHDNLKSDSTALSYQIEFSNDKITERYGDHQIIVMSSVRYIHKCKFEKEIKTIKTKLLLDDLRYKIGEKTLYQLIETGPEYIVLEYWCNEGRNTCTEILKRQ